jgi:hypothetical protein
MFKACQCIICSFYTISLIVGIYVFQEEPYDNSKFIKEGYDGKSCDDFIFGCCKFYDTCQVVNNTLVSTELDLNPDKVVCEDPLCENCPRLPQIILDYNDYMKDIVNDEICENGKHYGYHNPENNQNIDCSHINTACDIRYYYDVFKNAMGLDYDYIRNYQHQSDPDSQLNYNVYHNFGETTTIADIWVFYNNTNTDTTENIIIYSICMTVITSIITVINCIVHRNENYQKTDTSDASLP